MSRASVPALLRALRPHHWSKNLLVFVPLVTSHRLGEWTLVLSGGLAFLAFSLAASAGYVLNDLLDSEEDRIDPATRARPFASGELTRGAGVVLVSVLTIAALALAWATLPGVFLVALATYLAGSATYSWWLKRVPVTDVLVLAGLYCLRVIGGGIAEDTPVSEWLLAFSAFFFLGLAFLKRFVELRRFDALPDAPFARRGYQRDDRWVILGAGLASGYTSALVLALYINSATADQLYGEPRLLWLAGPLLLYWITRVWLLAHRGAVDDDPVMFAARDRATYAILALLALLLGLATVGWSV